MQANVTTLENAVRPARSSFPTRSSASSRAPDLIQRMVRWQLLKRMAGTHHAQDRSEVNVTGKKMYKQKGTGGARHGDKSVPQWRGGGKAFGPKPRSHEIEPAQEGPRAGAAPCAVGQGQGRRDRRDRRRHPATARPRSSCASTSASSNSPTR